MSRQYLVVEFDNLTDEDNPDEILRRADRALKSAFAHEITYFDWTVSAEEWFDCPVERGRVKA